MERRAGGTEKEGKEGRGGVCALYVCVTVMWEKYMEIYSVGIEAALQYCCLPYLKQRDVLSDLYKSQGRGWRGEYLVS